MELLAKILVCFLAGAGAGIGTGFAGMSAAAVIGPMLMDVPRRPGVSGGRHRPCKRCLGQRHKRVDI